MDTMAAAERTDTGAGVTAFLNDERRADGTDARLPDDAQHLHQPPGLIEPDVVMSDELLWTEMMKQATSLGMNLLHREHAGLATPQRCSQDGLLHESSTPP